jgi:hypothetical protein
VRTKKNNAPTKQRYYFRDFATGTLHYTCAPFGGWTEPSGELKCRYAWFLLRSENLYIPEYLLTPETKTLLEAKVLEAQQSTIESDTELQTAPGCPRRELAGGQ